MDWIAEKLREKPGRWEAHLSKYFRLMLYLLALSVLMAMKLPWVVEYRLGKSWEFYEYLDGVSWMFELIFFGLRTCYGVWV